MKLSWNFKFALGTIALVATITGGIFLYAGQLLGESNLSQQIDFYQLTGLRQSKILNNKIRQVRNEIAQMATTSPQISTTTSSTIK